MPVPLANLLAPQFRATPELMFSADGFHPSPTAYALAAEQLLLALCDALGEKVDGPVLDLPPGPSEPGRGGQPAVERRGAAVAASRPVRLPASTSGAATRFV